MKQLNFKQGTPEWAAWRATVDSASDAPAMLDEMPQKTRNKLVEEYATGFKAEHSDFIKDVVFPNGHRIEALLRPFAEKFWEDDLFPTCVEKNVGLPRPLGASLDGQSMDCATNWECKSMNDEIRKTGTAEDLPIRYRIQMEQGLEASGAERCIFSAGSFDKDGNLTEEKHFIYLPDLELCARILSGWKQFHKDVAAWVP
jgi:predicted phage-related endonuclease